MSNILDELRRTTVDRNHALFSEAAEVMPGGVNTSLRRIVPQLVFTRAQGAILVDAEGREYIDYHAAFGPVLLGHNFEAVNQRVREAMQQLDLVGVGVTEWEIALARKICAHVPSAEKVLFCNSGSEATYQAIRLARAVTGRKKIIKFQGCYHGWHDAVAMNVISPVEKLGRRDLLSAGSLPEVANATLVCRFNDLDDVERTIRENRGEIAAVILEPIPHNIGCVLPKPRFLEGLRELTRQHEILLIFDEVVTGFRHHLGGYQKVCGVIPDLTTLGKAMANGYPIAALCGRRELMDRFNTHPEGDVFFAGTYNGHPIGCAAALATLEVLETQPVHEHIFRLGERMRSGLREIIERLGIRATVAGFGSVFVLYFLEGPIESYEDLLRNESERFLAYRRKLIERGIFELPLNLKRNHISFSHTEAHIEQSLQVAEDVLRKLIVSASDA
ncbi:MAG: aspartate aminotransferase family protein [Blastocatellia bacterium]|nr:aspartate aminotransferase family protein [Blastocatellia bacterium]MCS7156094.1 aspartate aminotransferase family protein [Blastocatellia bacterium]MDW8169269.1 aspartate aminotransferase family protein [Acidobacteriota bacterium]MDW8256438.1 aspartate aminotransferase family protein [Acidobacteriota bacterium]